jgi:diacylglycerol kinase family enzyme
VRIALVVNARAGAEDAARAAAEALRAHGTHVGVVDVGDAAAAAEGRPDRIAVAGGDGSIGPVARAAAEAGIPLAVLPVGTANDFARALDLPRDLRDAAALAAAPDAAARVVEVALAGDRPFVNAASAGLSVLAARRARPLKRRIGAPAYAVGALLAAARAAPLPARVEELFEGPAWQVIVAASGAFGGGSSVDVADPGDGLLDVAVVEAGPRLALARHGASMRLGGLTERPGVHHARRARAEVALPDGTPWNVDGEVCRLAEPARFAVAPARLTVVVGQPLPR